MKALIRQLAIFLTAAGCILVSSTPAMADDTEVYLGSNPGTNLVKPNIVFIIDTSGSMATNITVTQSTYDPATTYTGSCDPSRIYYSRGTAPSCTTDNWFNATANKCDASLTALNTTGHFTDRLAAWKDSSRVNRRAWVRFSTSYRDRPVECEDDWGTHGDGVDTTKLYPADAGNGPWSGTASQGVDWSGTGRAYTLYTANYLNWKASAPTVSKTRLEIVQEVFNSLMDSTQDVNVAVMRYDDKSASYNKGGYFILPMQELDATTRPGIKTAVNALTPGGYTPLAETLYEAALFYRGEGVYFGDDTTPGTNHPDCFDATTNKYISPIDFQCQKNFIVLLTDGDPTYDTDADSLIQALPGFATVTGSSTCSGDCLDELALYLYKKDQRSDLDNTQNVITYTIGFTTNQALLNDTATKGGGEYYTADDTAGLTDAFTSIITDILAINTTFTAPAVSVNAFNRLTHRDELYFALFRPDSRPKWAGNIKEYKLGGDPLQIRDANGNPAVDQNTGFFASTATSFWTSAADAPDGDDVQLGGAAGMLTLTRNLYTYTAAGAPSEVNLSDAANQCQLHESNTAITAAMLGVDTYADPATRRTEVLQWARGVDLFDDDSDGSTADARRQMGDPLHTEPVLITYGGTSAAPDITLFASTNEGFLHAINATTGSEYFAFMPKELLPNLDVLMENASTDAHPYGLDGPISVWVKDVDKDGVIESGDGDHVYVYVGMRRGGKNYYALDVTNRAQPKLKWMIQGGGGDFSELAQTWSKPIVTKIKQNGQDTPVLIFGGGYDTNQDGNATAADDTMGRAIYIVNAETGAKIWQAGPAGPDLSLSGMTNSIPSEVRVIDIDADGYADRMYVGDMRGQIWRIDIDNSGTDSTMSGGMIASLGGATAAENRRFYYPPDVSLSKDRSYLNIAIGSGYRAHPLDKDIHDAFFVLRDKDVYTKPATYTTLLKGDLYNATSGTVGTITNGWYIDLAKPDGSFEGEKVLSTALTVDNKIMFTTFTPVASAQSSCAPSQGTARFYVVSATDASPVNEYDNVEGLTREDRSTTLTRGGIPPQPTLLFPDGSAPIVLVGPELMNGAGVPIDVRKTFWWRQ